MSNAFEAAFDAFLERREYDEAQQAQFALVRAAFLAGWLAAGGDRPQQARLFEVLRPEKTNDPRACPRVLLSGQYRVIASAALNLFWLLVEAVDPVGEVVV